MSIKSSPCTLLSDNPKSDCMPHIYTHTTHVTCVSNILIPLFCMAVRYILDKYNARLYQVFCSKIQPHIHSYVTYVHVEILELNYMLSMDM